MAQEEFDGLISVGAYDEAHTVLMLKIFPVAIRSTSLSDLEPALEIIRETCLFQHQHRIAHWSLGGGLIQSIHRLTHSILRMIELECVLVSWLGMDLSFLSSLSPLLDAMHPIEFKIREAKQFWVRLADSDPKRNQVERMYDVLSYYLEKKYSKAYAVIYGEEYIMTRILNEKCKKQESFLNFLQ